MKIHSAVRLDNEVYLANNEEHAALLADRLTDRQKIRLSEAGAISGPGSEVAGHDVVRSTPGKVDDEGGVITKAPSKKSKATKAKAAKTKAVKAEKAKAKADTEAAAAEAEAEAQAAKDAAENEGGSSETTEDGKEGWGAGTGDPSS